MILTYIATFWMRNRINANLGGRLLAFGIDQELKTCASPMETVYSKGST